MLFLAIVLAVFFLLALFSLVDSQRRQADAMQAMANAYMLGAMASLSEVDLSAATNAFKAQAKRLG